MNKILLKKEKQALNEFKKILFQELGKHISGEKITQQHNHSFKVSKPGLVAIFISARCKSKKQLNSNIDEDLRAEINGIQFREIPPEKKVQLFNIPASWNGSKLKGLKKTIVFLMVLDKGEHVISLIPDENTSASVEDIKVKQLSSTQSHYIEFWADKTPVLHRVELDLGEKIETKRIPTVNDPKWTGDLKDGPEDILYQYASLTDPRVRPRIEDPLNSDDPAEIRAWHECYKVANQVIKGEIHDPTDGAMFFHDKRISSEKFISKVPRAVFVKQIGDLFFYTVKQ